MDAPEETRTCLLCRQDFDAALEACPHCIAPEPVAEPLRRSELHHGFGVPGLDGLGAALTLIVLGPAVFLALWMAGWIWPYPLILSLVGAAMVPHAQRRHHDRREARRRLAARRQGRPLPRRRR